VPFATKVPCRKVLLLLDFSRGNVIDVSASDALSQIKDLKKRGIDIAFVRMLEGCPRSHVRLRIRAIVGSKLP